MLRDVRMAAVVKLHCGGVDRDQWQVWADHVASTLDMGGNRTFAALCAEVG
ncbi:hypothetical protein [Roseovarius litorisediminis]|uniref:hypothetical protein n=1 Tax=Roseovarius litorisediminis TaxID=1312363 RepID=UPI0015944337|nr:hypothetical protein [Roseovarius litorisediminis]